MHKITHQTWNWVKINSNQWDVDINWKTCRRKTYFSGSNGGNNRFTVSEFGFSF